MKPIPVNLKEKLNLFSEQWSPRIVAQMNNYHFKLVKFQGDFVWHSHSDTDETFLVIKGEMKIDFQDGSLLLKEGELAVVPRLMEHKPFAKEECHVLLFEPEGTINTGDAGGNLTAKDNEWI